MKTKRLNVPFNEKQWNLIKAEAQRLNISMANIVRIYFNLGVDKGLLKQEILRVKEETVNI
jgi:hypothetical protein